MFMHTPILERWSHVAAQSNSTVVLPDGCRDVIGRLEPDGHVTWWLTDWVDSAYVVKGLAGQMWVGYRLQPGVCLREESLKRQIACFSNTPLDADLQDLLADHARLDDDSSSALQALASGTRVAKAAQSLGVSERSLHRNVLRKTGKPPSYWLQLARARRAARDLRSDIPLADLAAAHGYADQAHLSRSMRQWFGASPERLRQMPQHLNSLDFSGYC